ncbi:hypothetical protein BS47DRAFT_1305617 [Hydnum rufescens UP504]|uniref:Tc1-like transposase DDE domain-containing protein n=1 Tax=Hydnum rufescens UP504 TaxID=1448309 RepID=A0A9P6AIX0_9AGAM|nr:hypothetical protein BS47DRAFT_1305617 [Hydnum rufescens UP504]
MLLIIGSILLYLPPYSPDYNPIEQSFSLIKAWMCIPDIDKDMPLTFLHSACDSITAEKAEGWYCASGFM